MGRKWGTFLQSHRYLPPQAVKHRNMEWIKTIDKNGLVKNINWSEKYNILRRYLNSSYPEGYVWHEAVVWNPNICKWFILPRKVSQNTPYDPVSDEVMGSNVMIIASDDWQSEEDLELRHVGPLEPEWGYTSVKVIPDSNDLMALKAFEVDGKTKTQIHVFDGTGKFLMEPVMIGDDVKYEGLEFLT